MSDTDAEPAGARRPSLGLALLAAWALTAAGCAIDPRAQDPGRLDASFFGADLPFRATSRVDFLWVKEGFDLDGRTLHVMAWPAFVSPGGPKPTAADQVLAAEIASHMPALLHDMVQDEWRGLATVSMTSGDIRVIGRVVDCTAGNRGAKLLIGFGAGAGSATVDVAFVERRTGEPVVALRHRVVSATTWSSPRGKLEDWLEELAEDVDDHGFGRLYAEGTPISK